MRGDIEEHSAISMAAITSVRSPSTKQPVGDTVSMPPAKQRSWSRSGTRHWQTASWKHTPGDALLQMHPLARLRNSGDRHPGFLPSYDLPRDCRQHGNKRKWRYYGRWKSRYGQHWHMHREHKPTWRNEKSRWS